MTMPVQTGPSDKEQAIVGLNHALLNAFHNLYLGKKRQVPPGLLESMQLHQNPGQQDISQQTPVVTPPTPLQMPKQNMSGIPLTAIAARLMGRRD